MAIQKAPSLPTSRWSKNVINVGTNFELGLPSHSQQVFLFCSFNVPSKEEGLMSQIILDLFKSKEVVLSDTIFRGIQRHSKVQISLLHSCLLVLSVGRRVGDMVQLSMAVMFIHGLLFSWQFPCL